MLWVTFPFAGDPLILLFDNLSECSFEHRMEFFSGVIGEDGLDGQAGLFLTVSSVRRELTKSEYDVPVA